MIKNILLFILLFFSIYFFSAHRDSQRNKRIEITNLENSLNDTVKIWRDKDSLSHARISSIETENINVFLKLKRKDKKLKELQSEVKKYKDKIKDSGSVSIISSTSTIYIKTPITLDSINSDIHISYFNLDDWVKGQFKIFKDSVSINMSIRNKYTVILGKDKKGPFAEVISANPFTELTGVKTYNINKVKEKRFGIGVLLGVGLTSTLQVMPVVSIGLCYQLYSF